MKYQINNFKISPSDDLYLEDILRKKFKLNNFEYKIIQKSIDARDKDDIKIVYKLMIDTNTSLKGKDVFPYEDKTINLTYPKWNDLSPVVVGFGPAGMFAALYLARCNAKPIIIERGSKIEDRQKTVDELKQAQRDAILSSLNVYGPTYSKRYPYMIKKCPICGRDPEVIHHEAYDVYDIQCISKFLKTPHLFVFGKAEESKKDVVDRWNKLVLEYEIDQEDNDHPCWLRRYL